MNNRMICFLVILTAGLPLPAQDILNNGHAANFTFTPYLWFAEIDGDITLRGRTGEAEASFSDIWNNLNIGVMGRLEGWDDQWGFFLDGMYMGLETDYATPGALLSAELDLDMSILEFGLGYRLWEAAWNDSGLEFSLLGGGRYFNLEGDLDIVPGGPLADLISGRSFDRREEWVDLIVGGRLTWILSQEWSVSIRGDIGGFGIGDSSDMTWNLVAGVDYRWSDSIDLRAGYRILDIDYDSGGGTDAFGLDAQFRGPILGMGIRF